MNSKRIFLFLFTIITSMALSTPSYAGAACPPQSQGLPCFPFPFPGVEDTSVNQGYVNGDTLTLGVGGNSPVTSRNVDIDVSSLNQSGEVATNANRISTNQSAINNAQHATEANAADINTNSQHIGTNSRRINANESYIKDVQQASDANSMGVSRNSQRISANQGAIKDVQDATAKNADGIATNTSTIEQVEKNTNTNTANIATNASTIEQVEKNTSVNADNIAKNTERSESNARMSESNAQTNESQGQSIEENSQRSKNNEAAIARYNDYNGQMEQYSYGIQSNRQAIADTNARIDRVMNDMKYLEKNMSAGIANAIAMGQHHFDPTYNGGQVSFSGGHFNGQNAVSFAVGVPAGNHAFFSASAAANSASGNESIGVGLTIRLPK